MLKKVAYSQLVLKTKVFHGTEQVFQRGNCLVDESHVFFFFFGGVCGCLLVVFFPFSHRNFRVEGADSFGKRQTSEMRLHFFVLQICLEIGCLGLNAEGLSFATLMFRFLTWQTQGCESCFVSPMWCMVESQECENLIEKKGYLLLSIVNKTQGGVSSYFPRIKCHTLSCKMLITFGIYNCKPLLKFNTFLWFMGCSQQNITGGGGRCASRQCYHVQRNSQGCEL